MHAPRWHTQVRDGVRLLCADYGGAGDAAVLVHGLAGYAREWDGTAAWLVDSHRVVAVEQRGHGLSERRPQDVSRQAFVDDLAGWIDVLGVAPAVVIGQSLGGHTAFLLAAQRPDLVRALVVAEATPEIVPDAPRQMREWLDAWPVPFAGRGDALAHFGDTAWGRAWADGLERRQERLWPAFDTDVMVAALEELAVRSYWDEWGSVACPVLVVRGEDDGMGAEPAERMKGALPSARTVAIAGAGHDLHLEQPSRWREVVSGFLETLSA
jgi:pimeloyl-ACP methyl ester carboxylesterase